MIETKLYAMRGEYVATVLIPPFVTPADAIVWGSRMFILKDGKYIEGLAFYAVQTIGHVE